MVKMISRGNGIVMTVRVIGERDWRVVDRDVGKRPSRDWRIGSKLSDLEVGTSFLRREDGLSVRFE